MAAQALTRMHSTSTLIGHHCKRPAFHCAPKTGWINDPNAPILVKDTYHLFYQHVPDSSEWQWGLVWGHAKSKDLVHWEHLPVALSPSPGGLDRDGCFSGCAALDLDGRPSLLYTGVIRKAPHELLPGDSHQHEAQLIAVAADTDDPDLTEWRKLAGNFLPNPPAEDMGLTGWRDPFVLQRPCSATGNPWWVVMVGAGIKGKCGTAMVYRSRDLTSGWQYAGLLCEDTSSTMWECPIMAHLSNTHPEEHARIHHHGGGSAGAAPPQPLRQRHMLCVSPDFCVNTPRFWLGDYEGGRFDLAAASAAGEGPHLLDLGDIIYAPNILQDKHGRTVLWGWMQETRSRPAGAYNSACCLSVPRVLYLSPDGSSLLQEPLPELRLLRQQQGAWHVGDAAGAASPALQLPAGSPVQLGGAGGSHLDVELVVARGSAESVVLLLQPFEGAPAGSAGAGVSYCWATNTLQVIHSTDLATLECAAACSIQPPAIKKLPAEQHEGIEREAAAAPARCGGQLRTGSAGQAAAADDGAVIRLRVLIDGSCLEVFTANTGEALSTRVYRGNELPLDHCLQPAAEAPGGAGGHARGGELQLVAFGGCARLLSASVWAMSDIWLQPQQDVAPAANVAVAAAEALQGLVAAELAAVTATAAAAAAPLVLPVAELSLETGGAKSPSGSAAVAG